MIIGGGAEAFATVMMLGVRVREVASLGERAIWLPKRMLLLIDQDLSDPERASVADQVLCEAVLSPHHHQSG